LSLAKTGTGTWVLTAAETYGGTTNVSGGTLNVAASASLPSTTNVTADANLVLNPASQAIASLNGASTGSLVLNGTGLTINNGGTFNGAWNSGSSPSIITVAGGTMTFGGPLAANGTVIANSATHFSGTTGIVTATRAMSTLNIANGVTAQITHSTFPFTPTVLRANSATVFNGTAKVDITNNAFITTGTAASALAKIQGGVIFSSEPADPGKAIGYIDLGGADTGKYEVRYTLKGDADLDGAVGVGDLGALATAYNGPGSWQNGDFDQSGTIGVGDLGALATNYGTQLGTGPSFGGDGAAAAPLAVVADVAASSSSAAVPEPATFGSLLLAAGIGLSRRRRRNVR
jgi:autotransporter-associated beta strand protein